MDFTDNIQINELTKKQETTWLKLLIKCIEPKGLNPDSKWNNFYLFIFCYFKTFAV